MIPTIVGISIIIFLMVRLMPGDIVDVLLGGDAVATQEQKDQVREQLGLTGSYPEQYWNWASGVVTGDFGESYRNTEPVADVLSRAVPITLELMILALLIATLIGVPLGVISAVRRDSVSDYASRVGGLVGISIPSFWLATLLLLFTSRVFGWVPPITYVPFFDDPLTNLSQFILPAISISVFTLAIVMRMVRATMLEVLSQDYVRTARAKGVQHRLVVYRHALRNALIPVVTIIGFEIGVRWAAPRSWRSSSACPGSATCAGIRCFSGDGRLPSSQARETLLIDQRSSSSSPEQTRVINVSCTAHWLLMTPGSRELEPQDAPSNQGAIADALGTSLRCRDSSCRSSASGAGTQIGLIGAGIVALQRPGGGVRDVHLDARPRRAGLRPPAGAELGASDGHGRAGAGRRSPGSSTGRRSRCRSGSSPSGSRSSPGRCSAWSPALQGLGGRHPDAPRRSHVRAAGPRLRDRDRRAPRAEPAQRDDRDRDRVHPGDRSRRARVGARGDGVPVHRVDPRARRLPAAA